ncbi:hypothetical protein ACOSQ3_017175 [Xanthoceras sorbifolium]
MKTHNNLYTRAQSQSQFVQIPFDSPKHHKYHHTNLIFEVTNLGSKIFPSLLLSLLLAGSLLLLPFFIFFSFLFSSFFFFFSGRRSLLLSLLTRFCCLCF